MISAALIKDLRDKTGAGMMDCKRALEKTDGDLEKAVDYLRTTGIAKAEQKASRDTSEGIVTSYIHPGSKLGVLLEVKCETDFVVLTDGFQQFVKDIAMQIAAAAPIVVVRSEVPQEILEHERNIYLEQARQTGKPDHILEKIVDGRMEKFLAEKVLLEQAFVKDPQITINDYLKETIGNLGENISIARFARFQLGETDSSGSGTP